ncbi:MAG: hypothetical protein K2L95_00985 [Alphaproteobacteria bacterium]|nr:hypothetical protein [Alphaproteobacteria bacterium]
MKTKIIYISGNEIFDMADIRAAFDEVRSALNLGGDTVLFGVPVDADDAGLGINDTPVASDTADVSDAPISMPEPDIAENAATPAPEMPDIPETPAPRPKRRTRTRATTAAATDTDAIDVPTPDVAPDADDAAVVTPAADTPTDDVTQTDTIIPILSVLASNAPAAADVVDTPAPSPVPEMNTPEPESDPVTPATNDIPAATTHDTPVDTPIDTPVETPVAESETIVTITETVTIEDMLTDDAPTPPVEKTLEQLLEKMTPLREDHTDILDTADDVMTPTSATEPESIADGDGPQMSDADATLAQLATEFAENEDKIVPMPRAENHGKIGKLKNILPFKKAKRDDAGLMGDLFGWAGIAANDDEFSIPGFFTNAASKK